MLSGSALLRGPGGILLTPREINAFLQRSRGPNAVPLSDRFLSYQTPQGGRVTIFLHGNGSLKGSSLNPDGSLNLVFSGTNSGTAISGNVQGGGGHALLASIRDAKAAIGDYSGVNTEPLSLIKLRNFELIPGGSVNLSGGVGLFLLDSVGPNSQIHLTATQAPSFTPLRSTVNNIIAPNVGVSVTTGSGATAVGASGPSGIQAFGFGTLVNPAGTVGGGGGAGGPGGAAGGAAPIAATISGFAVPPSLGGGPVFTIGTYPSLGAQFVPSFTTTPSIGGTIPGANASSATGQAIRIGTPAGSGAASVVGTSPNALGGGATSIGGTTVSQNPTATTTTATTPPPGADLIINHINGPSAAHPLGDPQIFGLDPVTNSLIRFDVRTGDALQSISLAGMGSPIGGVSMGRDNGSLVALVTNGSVVQAYGALTGALVGQFSTASLAGNGLTRIDGLGSTNSQTVVTDSSAGTLGLAQIIDVSASLASGMAVPVGAPYSPQREFEFAGGSTGLAGTDVIYQTGAAHFDPAQPDQKQIGVIALDASGKTLAEIGRGPLQGASPGTVNAGPPGTTRGTPFQALGSAESYLALVTGVDQGGNNVTLYNPVNLAAIGAIKLKDPNRLSGLGESFHPEIAGSALIDTVGQIHSVRIQNAKGLVFNSNGSIDYLQIGRAVDSAVVARPIGHVSIGSRRNLLLLSNSRPQGSRNGVTVKPNLNFIGPLILP